MVKPRAGTVLRFLVNEYIATATPVASESLARRAGLGVSPATVRNDMAELEEEGYIVRPHISAGGVPSDKGYRYYVESLEAPHEPPPEVQQRVRQRFGSVEQEWEAWVRLAATVLSGLTSNLALVTLPWAVRSRLRHLELVYLQEFLALLIVVLQEARLRQQLLPLPEAVGREELERAANKLNTLYAGQGCTEIAQKAAELSPFEALVRDRALALMRTEEEQRAVDHAVDGLRLLLSQPEFQLGDKAREVAEALEEQVLLRYLLSETPQQGEVRVVIGSENREEMLRSFGVVFCRYGLPGDAVGIMGVVGPTRMPYNTTIGSMRFIASFMGEMVASTHG